MSWHPPVPLCVHIRVHIHPALLEDLMWDGVGRNCFLVCSWHLLAHRVEGRGCGCAVKVLVGHLHVWHFLSEVPSWETSFLSDLFACHNSQETRLGVDAVLPCVDAEECRASDPNMLCTVPCSICSSMVMSFVLYVDIDEFLENISHHKNGSQSIWFSPLVRESSKLIMLSEISLSLWMCVEFNEPFYSTCSPSAGKDVLQRDVESSMKENIMSVFRDLFYLFIYFSCNV